MILYIFTILFSSVFIGLISIWYYQYLKHNPYYQKYKGPPPIPLFGNLYKIFSAKDVIPAIMDYHKRYGPVIKMWFGFTPRIFISDCKTTELLLTSNTLIDKSYDYYFFEAWLGTGLLTSTGAKWRRQRKLLTPAFHFKILEQYIKIFNSQSNILIKLLQNHTDSKAFNIYPYINLCTLDIICEAIMGIQINAQTGSAKEYVKAVTEATEIFLRRTFSPIKSFDFVFRLSRDYWKLRRALRVLHGLTISVINSRQREFATLQDNEKEENTFGNKKNKAFLDLLLQFKIEGKHLPFENIREEVDTFMFEGHDTTTSAICFILYNLSQYVDVQDQVIEELHSIFDHDKDTPASYNDLQEMKYLEKVIKESLRVHPAVPIMSRSFPKGSEFDGTIFCNGATVSIFHYTLHRQEEFFPDPDRFDPERFSHENCANRSPFAYVPFSAGARNCIGQRFAMLELKSVVSKILRNFEVLPDPGYKPILAPDAILRSLNGVWLCLRERKF